MELQSLWAPLCGAAVVGLSVLQFSPEGVKPATGDRPLWPWAWGALALLCVWSIGVRFGLIAPSTGTQALSRVLGIVLLATAAMVAHVATRHRSRAEALMENAPVDVDEAVSALARGEPAASVVIRGRLSAREQVTSPGGIVCAFYEAELRALGEGGEKGVLLSKESGGAQRVYLRGDRFEISVERETVGVVAPEQIHRCRLGGNVAFSEELSLAEGIPPSDSLSYERVGKLGEPCVAVGRLFREARGGYVLKAAQGIAPMLVVSEDLREVGRRLGRRAWFLYAGAVALCGGAAYLLGNLIGG